MVRVHVQRSKLVAQDLKRGTGLPCLQELQVFLLVYQKFGVLSRVKLPEREEDGKHYQ